MTTLTHTPLPSRQQHHHLPKSGPRKRKRRGHQVEQDGILTGGGAPAMPDLSEEYTAVLAPDERNQRRVAGYPLIASLPQHPFPHAAAPDGASTKREPYTRQKSHAQGQERTSHSSLRSQHLSAMTAVLHQCLMKKDYIRASRALGLILRTDTSGQSIDIRASGNWAIGAEILLRRDAQSRREQNKASDPVPGDPTQDDSKALPFTRQGFEDAKALYENLIIQYPYHKAWPDAVNAIDFYLAMFSLWMYVAQAEAMHQQEEQESDQSSQSPIDYISRLRDLKLGQINQANEIVARMEKCMSSAPYSDNQDLLRMRAMLAQWLAHLNNECQEVTRTRPDEEGWSPVDADTVTSAVENLNITDEGIPTARQLSEASAEAQRIAQRIFDRLGMMDQSEDCRHRRQWPSESDG